MKLTSMTIITALLLQTLAPGLSFSSENQQNELSVRTSGRTGSPPLNGGGPVADDESAAEIEGRERRFHGEWARVRVEAPSISKKPIIGMFINATPNALVVLSNRGREVRLQMSSVENFEVSIKRSSNTAKGMLIGIVLVGAYFFPGVMLDEADIVDLRPTSAAIFLSSAVIGMLTKSDEWTQMSPYRLKPSVAITRNRGFGPAVSFDF